MAKDKFMQEMSVQELIDQFNFYVPEIQREYVWGHNEREILDVFFQDLKDGKHSQADSGDFEKRITELKKAGKLTKQEILELAEEMDDSKPMNIGFLYSYEPNYRMDHFPQSDIYHDVYLIDGQQRLTTLFITLFYLSIKEERKDEFCELFRFNPALESVAFDYRVRNLTHHFIIDLITNVNTLQDFAVIEDSTWFLSEYAYDPTVSTLLKAFQKIAEHFEEEEGEYFDYIKSHVKFWHFKTEKTDQGEELYITMNSRGKQLENNETLRAKLFEQISKEEELLSWSEKWEHWQDFFWVHRDKDDPENSADDGFNEFLRCIAGFEALKSASKDFIEPRDPIHTSRLLKYLSLHKIQNYFNVLQFLYDNQNQFKDKYEYSNWINKCLSFIQNLFFESKTNWFINYNNENRANERRRMVFIWSIFDYLTSLENLEEHLDEIFRFVRVYWLRYNNLDRSVSSIRDRCQSIVEAGVWTLTDTSDDEQARHEFLNSIEDKAELRKFESAIWKIEDHPLNLNGYQVRLMNITHLVDFNTVVTLKSLSDIYERFIKLFGEVNSPVPKVLNTILLFYGNYGRLISPYYYDNWDFSNWRRIIRDLDSSEKPFKTFFDSYKGEDLNELWKSVRQKFIIENANTIEGSEKVLPIDDFLGCLRFYAIIVDNLWKHGRYIAVYENIDSSRLCKYEAWEIYNTHGSFRGYNNTRLWDLDPSRKLKKLKELVAQITVEK